MCKPRLVGLVVLSLLSVSTLVFAEQPPIIDRPIQFGQQRVDLTLQYIRRHYGINAKTITIVPQAIVIHWTGTRSLKATWRGFNRTQIRSSRRYIARGGALNVSAHFLVDRDGTIYRLMPETWMARHCIGLNYDSVGIENIGGGKAGKLTKAQLDANVDLVHYLSKKHNIRYLLGHMEWRNFEKAPFFRERDPTYRNTKADPGRKFMRKLRARLKALDLRGVYRSYKSEKKLQRER